MVLQVDERDMNRFAEKLSQELLTDGLYDLKLLQHIEYLKIGFEKYRGGFLYEVKEILGIWYFHNKGS